MNADKHCKPEVPSPDSSAWGLLRKLARHVNVRQRPRRLRLCESLGLGDKRFVAVIEFDEKQFLVGGGPATVSLLAQLGESSNFSATLTDWCERQR